MVISDEYSREWASEGSVADAERLLSRQTAHGRR